MSAALIAWLALPLVAGLQRFSVTYGYEGLPKAGCRRNALLLVVLLYLAEGVVTGLMWIGGQL